MLTAFGVLIGLQLAGEIVVHLLMLPLPGPVVGLVFLYVGLMARGGVPESLRVTTDGLLQHLMLFLVPATTGLILHLQRLWDEWLPIVLAGVGGTAITMVATAVTLRFVSQTTEHAVMDTAEGTAAFLQASSLAWVAMTVLAYRVALTVYQWTGRSAFANPVFVSVIIVMAVLSITRTPYAVYADGAQSVHLLIGPATVAMAVPLYTHTERLKTVAGSLLVALLVGSITAILSAVVIGWLFGASADTLLSLAPKSTTMPVAMGITEKVGGLPSLTSLTVTITGISGAIMARGVLDRAAVDDMAARGFAIGVTSHAIGTAYALQISEVAGAFAALGMGLNSIATTVLLPVMVHLLARL